MADGIGYSGGQASATLNEISVTGGPPTTFPEISVPSGGPGSGGFGVLPGSGSYGDPIAGLHATNAMQRESIEQVSRASDATAAQSAAFQTQNAARAGQQQAQFGANQASLNASTSALFAGPTITGPMLPPNFSQTAQKPLAPAPGTMPAADQKVAQATQDEVASMLLAQPRPDASPQPGTFERLANRIGDNYRDAFARPLGPGPETRAFLDRYTLDPLGFIPFDLSAADAIGRGIGATYESAVDAGTEGLAALGMNPISADRLGRDLKAMPGAFAGSPGAVLGRGPTLPGSASALAADGTSSAQVLQAARGDLATTIGTRARQLELGRDPARGFIEAEGIAGVRIEQALGRPITRGTDAAVDFVDRNLGPISLKGPIPVNGSLGGLANAAIRDAMGGNTATRTVIVDTLGLSEQQFGQLKGLIDRGTVGTQKTIILLR